MSKPLLNLEIRLEQDVVLARQRARQIAALLQFDGQDQVRIATAVSEIARNAFQYAGGGKVEFLLGAAPPTFLIRVRDRGPGIANLQTILDGQYRSPTGMGVGIVGARRLMDHFAIESAPGAGTTIELGRILPRQAGTSALQNLGKIADELARSTPQNPFEEVRHQNQELMRALDDLRSQQEALAQVNRELEDTNRGVVALYAELDEKADFLRRASEMKSRFLSNMSHEFRTPLNSILGLSRLLLDRVDGELNSEQEKQIQFIRKAAEGLMELVNDLLDLARVEAGKVLVRANEFQADALFGALRGMLRPLLAHNTAVSLVFDEPVGLPVLNTDESKVSQILRNFISNALKFTERGEVRVTAARFDDAMVIFSVADTGMGIAAADQERIFEEFVQVDNPKQRVIKGTGLGLPLVKKLAGLLGGYVTLSSELNVGSTFSVVLPVVYQGPTEAAFVPDLTAALDPARRPVLVVEDNRETLFIYEKFLKGSGYQVIPARTVSEARRVLSQFRPIAVVLDVLLESESTWSLLAELKQSAGTREIPVIVVTMVENEHKARALGADAFHAKPVERAWLLSALSSTRDQDNSIQALIIDDDETSRYLLKSLLAGEALHLREAATGAEGLALVERESPQIVFLDLELPDLSGLEILRQLKENKGTREITVIIHTSKTLAFEDRQRLLDQGAAAVLSKGFSSRETALALIREALGQAGFSTSKERAT